MAYIRIETTGDDGLISSIIGEGRALESTISVDSNLNNKQPIFDFFGNGIINLVKYLGWVSLPIFFIFLPYGIFKILRNRNDKKTMIILLSIFFLLPAFYAYGREVQETRYLYIMFPIFSIFSLYTIERINEKFNKPTLIFVLVICGVLITSVAWIEYYWMDIEREEEEFKIATEVVKRTNIINDFYPEARYIRAAEIANLKEFPVLRSSISDRFEFISTEQFNSIDEYFNFGKDRNLEYIVIDNNPNRQQFMKDVFLNEEKYDFLIKEFDSKDQGFNYHVKIFRIDYEKFDSIK